MSREAHPLANLFPTMTDTAYAELRESIRINGQREAITLHRDGRVIDGRNRDRVGDELGIQVRTKLFEGTDADILPFVMDINVVRRHLDESQRAVVAAKLAKMREGRPAKTAQICAVSQDQAATMLNVSRRSVQHASEVLTHAAPEIIAAVEQGVMAVSVAAGVARKPPARISLPGWRAICARLTAPVASPRASIAPRRNARMACWRPSGSRRKSQRGLRRRPDLSGADRGRS